MLQVPDGRLFWLEEAQILLIPEPQHRLPQEELNV